MGKGSILIVEDEMGTREGLKALLQDEEYEVTLAEDGQVALELISDNSFDLVLADLVMPKLDGLELLRILKEEEVPSQIIIITGKGSIDTAVAAIKDGAYDYLEKPVFPERLLIVIEKAMEKERLLRSNELLRQRLKKSFRYADLVGKSDKMKKVFKLIEQVAPTEVNVLIWGDSGTGKELVARAIHDRSTRHMCPFLAINCAALPENLLESELFGYEKGAFTGALTRKEGFFELAQGGTLFLDEIGEMSPNLQAKLLRVLETKSYRSLGAREEVEANVRIISSTNRNIQEALTEGTLREDLFWRLGTVRIFLPPLRERLEDIPLLASTLLEEIVAENNKDIKGFSGEATMLLMQHQWSGNVRELKNAIEQAVVFAKGDIIQPEDLALIFDTPSLIKSSFRIPFETPIKQVEKDFILESLEYYGGNKTRTANALGISLKTLHNKLNAYKKSV
jgi:DNA-binding NtrC family response regulator